jgi:hypothetical protein
MTVWTFLSSTLIVAKLLFGSAAMLFSDGNWFMIAIGPFLYGRAFLSLGSTPGLSRVREAINLQPTRALQLYAVSYLVAGGCALVGCLSLAPPLAVIVAIFITAWVALWAWTFWQLQRGGPHT